MRSIAIVFLFLVTQSHAQTAGYDSILAKKLHADQYGMKKYVLVVLKTGPLKITDKSKSDSLFSGHMKNILRLAAENKLILAGPLQKNDKTYEGIFVLNTDSIQEATQMLETDPAVHAGALASELYLWYSTAAIQEIPAIHNKIAQTHF